MPNARSIPSMSRNVFCRVAFATCGLAAGGTALAVTGTSGSEDTELKQPLAGSATADVDGEMRFIPTTRPAIPVPQFPPQATPQNSDTNKPPQEWQRLTDDWYGVRPWLDDRGFSINGSVAVDIGRNLRGGVKTSHGGIGDVVNLNVTLDTEKLVGWQGGSLFVNAQSQNGLENSLDGAYQVTSHVYSEERNQISEAWYQQEFVDSRVRVRAGKIDANGQFVVPETSQEFLNSSSSFSPTILGFPTDPDPAFGVTAFITPTEWLYAGGGVFDGSTQAGRPTGSRGPSRIFDGDAGAFLIGEVGGTWKLQGGTLPGRAAVGVWHHTGEFGRFDGTTDVGANGPYVMFDQALYRVRPNVEDDGRGLGLFVTCGYADPAISTGTLSVTSGLVWTGLGDVRKNDVFGVAINWLDLSDQAGTEADSETVFEAFYKLQLLKWLSVKPDLQYVLSPAGADDDALMATVRVVADF